jgi:hypothetical protein
MEELTKRQAQKQELSLFQKNYIADAICESETYKSLVRSGKSPKEIYNILGISSLTPERFEAISGKAWPA